MTFIYILLICIVLLLTAVLILLLRRTDPSSGFRLQIQSWQQQLDQLERNMKEDFRINRREHQDQTRENRSELNNTLLQSLREFRESFEKSIRSLNQLQREQHQQQEQRQQELVQQTANQLDLIRNTVSEKLEQTLKDRLGQSFETVGKQLIAVQKGLGEMQILAQDVGGLKKVLGNVKLRGGIGEIQLSLLLEQILAPEQYAANVKTKVSGQELVEFAIKLPGGREQEHIWLPVDAKFPRESYQALQDAADTGDAALLAAARKSMEQALRKMAADIRDKYISPPETTDFAILFLPFEGIYAEVVRSASLLEDLQRHYKVIITGPSTLAAILNSLQMGFRTLAIQKRSSEVWSVLAAVKKEFESFGGMMQKAQNNIQQGLNQLDDVMGKRTRAIQRRLRDVQTDGNQHSLPLPDAEE